MDKNVKKKQERKKKKKEKKKKSLVYFQEPKPVANFMVVWPRFRRVSRLNENEAYFFSFPEFG